MLTNDIELAGTPYNVLPGAYKKGLRKPLAVSKPPARKTGSAIFGPFERGVLQASDADEERGWSSLTVGPVFDGEGVEPFPNSATHADAMSDTPSATTRAYGVVAGSAAYVGIGRRIYKSVALTNGVWASFTIAADLGAGFTISGLTYWQDDILIMLASGQDIRKLNTTTNAVSVWRTAEKAKYGVAYAGQLIYAPCLANNQEELRLSGTKWNGNAVTHLRYLDAPIINMASFNGQVVIATRKSLYFMGGQPYPGEADDAAITGDSSRAPEWRGDPDPVMSHGVYAEGDDFIFLESYRGRLYTWLGGRVSEFDDSTEEANWLRIGPEGVRCYGAAVAGDWLIVAVQSRYGTYEAWGFDGQGWWLLLQRTGIPAVVWPMPLAGAGNRDALLFRDGSLTYDLLRLRWRSTALHTYASSGEWVSSLIDGNDPTADKAWKRIGATFAAPSTRGNTASVDSVSFPVEYSTDGGVTWVTAVDVPAASGATRVLTREVAFPVPPQSRLLQLRQRWSSVLDWAPVLTSLWVEYENAEDYALAELAQATYEAELAREATLRRRWELTIDAGDRRVRRDGQLDAKTGRQAITALWDAWELGTTVTFKDIDNDTDPTLYIVSIAGMEEKAAKPADGARWGESTVTLILEESSPGVAAAPPGWGLEELDDVTLGALVEGHVLTYDSATGQWINEPGGGDVDGPAASVDGEVALYLGVTGKQLKRADQDGIGFLTDGVLSALGSSGSGDVLRADGPIFGAGGVGAGSKPKLTTGALLTTPELGALELAAGIPYLTPMAGNRAVDLVGHFSRQDADTAHWANVLTATALFEAAQDRFDCAGGTVYELLIVGRLSCAGVVSVTLAFGLAGTATYNNVDLQVMTSMVATDAIAVTSWDAWMVSAGPIVVTGATGATAKFMNFRIEGTVDVANAGGIVPQGKWSAAPGNVTSVKRGTFWRMTPIGPSGLVSVGDFA